MTDQMDPVDEATQYRRRIDDSIARFSAAHDEMEAEEAERRQRRNRVTAGPARLIEQTRTRLQRITTEDGDGDAGDGPSSGAEQNAAGTGPDKDAGGRGAPAAHAGGGKPDRTRLQEKKRRRSHRSVLTGQVAACVLAALVFLATAAGWGAKEWFNAEFDEVAALSPDSEAIQDAAQQIGDANFLIIGSDTRKGASKGERIGSTATTPGARSDTVMLVHVPKDRHRVVVVSFLRDLEISRPSCERWDPKSGEYTGETVPAASNVKLNTAYAVGGPKCITEVIQRITHMEVTHFVGVNFDGFKNMVSAVGGVKVNVEQPIIDRELGTVVAEAGPTRLKGQQALQYMRARKVINDPTGGYGRVDRQQKFIGALLARVMSRDVLLDTGKLTGLVKAFHNATFGANLGLDQLLSLARSMRKMNSGGIEFVTAPTTGEANQRGNEVLVQHKASALFDALVHGEPLPGDKQTQKNGTGASPSETTARAHSAR